MPAATGHAGCSHGMARELPSAWLTELAEGRGTGPVPAAVAREELDRRGRAAQESLCLFVDRLTLSIAAAPQAAHA